jgi:hypothetical protein
MKVETDFVQTGDCRNLYQVVDSQAELLLLKYRALYHDEQYVYVLCILKASDKLHQNNYGSQVRAEGSCPSCEASGQGQQAREEIHGVVENLHLQGAQMICIVLSSKLGRGVNAYTT